MRSLEDRLSKLEREFADARDRLEIYQKTAAYGPLVDGGDGPAAAALWTADGRYDWGQGLTETSVSGAVGREALEKIFAGDEHQSIIRHGAAHWLGLPHVVLRGDQATSLCYSCLLTRDSEAFRVLRVSVCLFEWARESGEWRIQRRRNRLLDGSPAASALLAEGMGAF